mmetsp:Transcript_13592/g.37742  ORF Transcript_13592/g.37742 Transcript_13592/m.37742 type:complete len:276 (-) Transcript_13592:77-904(-)
MAKTQVKRTVAKRKAVSSPSKPGKARKAIPRKNVKPSASLAGLKAVVINLKDREDRWIGVQKSAAKNAPWLKMERLDAVNGRANPPPAKDVCKKYSTLRMAKLFHWYRPKTVTMSGGERGCCASHLKAWRKCAASNRPLIVLEDDAVILPQFTATLNQALKEVPRDVGALWLTSKDRGTRKRIGEAIMQPSYLWTTVGYVIWPVAAKSFIKMLPMDMPVDNFMAWHIKEKDVKGLSVQPACVRQANTWNIGSDVPHSDDVALWDHPSNKNIPSLC